MRQMSFESVGIIRPGCPARPAAVRFRRAFSVPILTRPPIRATQPSSLLQISAKAFSHEMNTGLFTGKESLTKQKKNFPLELRAKTKTPPPATPLNKPCRPAFTLATVNYSWRSDSIGSILAARHAG